MKKPPRTKHVQLTSPQKSPIIQQGSSVKCIPDVEVLFETPKLQKEVTILKDNQENQENKNVKINQQESTTRRIKVRRDIFKTNPLRVFRRNQRHRSNSEI